jgi:hypothetical protein
VKGWSKFFTVTLADAEWRSSPMVAVTVISAVPLPVGMATPFSTRTTLSSLEEYVTPERNSLPKFPLASCCWKTSVCRASEEDSDISCGSRTGGAAATLVEKEKTQLMPMSAVMQIRCPKTISGSFSSGRQWGVVVSRCASRC